MKNQLAAAAAILAIDGLSILHHNSDTVAAELAVKAAGNEVPAFWNTSGYSNQIDTSFLHEVNRISLEDALRAVNAEDGSGPRSRAFLLGTLIPLNRRARMSLQTARGL